MKVWFVGLLVNGLSWWDRVRLKFCLAEKESVK